MRFPMLENKISKLGAESAGAEAFGVLPNSRPVEFFPAQLELVDCLDNRFGRLLVEKNACLAIDHCLGRPTPTKRDHRGAARLCLDRSDPKILFRRENESPGAHEMSEQNVIRLIPEN